MIHPREHAWLGDRCRCGARPPVTLKVSRHPSWHRGHKRDVFERIAASLP